MRIIFKIAKTELRDLFYSPIAWLILIIFTFQTGMLFSGTIHNFALSQEQGAAYGNLTYFIFASYNGLFANVQTYLYLYIPLLTMGLMSRELGSGSIKLLYSSPITNSQIVDLRFGTYWCIGGVCCLCVLCGSKCRRDACSFGIVGNIFIAMRLCGNRLVYV